MLFHKMRRSIRPMMWVILVAFAVSIPLMYARSTLQERGEKPLTEVNGVPISYASFAQSFQPIYEEYYEGLGGEISPETERFLRYQVLSDLVTHELLWQEAKKANIQVSEEETAAHIEAVMGNFASREAFMRALEMRKISYPEFKKDIVKYLSTDELVQRIKDSVGITEEEVRSYWIIDNERIEVEYIFIEPQDYRKEVKVSQEDMEKYYETYTDRFREPERIKVNYIRVAAEEFEDEVKISRSTMEDYYQYHLTDYQTPEKRRASHILIESDPDASKEEKEKAREEMDKIQSILEDGTDFATLARQYSQDSFSAEMDGDLGFFSYDEMVPSFSEVVFALKEVGEVTQIIESPFGYHLVKLTGIKLAYTETLEELEDEIEEILTREKTDALAQEEVSRVKNELDQGEISFQEYGKAHPQRAGTSSFFAIDEYIEEIGWAPEINDLAFSLKQGDIGPVIETFLGYYILGLEETSPSYIPNFDEVQEKVKEVITAERAQELAQQKAKFIKLEQEKGASFFSLAEEQKLIYEHLEPFNRQIGILEIYGEDKEKFIDLAFSLPVGKIGEPILLTDGYYLINPMGRDLPWEEFPEQKEEFKQNLLSQKREAFLLAWLAKIREKAKIVDNSSLFFPS